MMKSAVLKVLRRLSWIEDYLPAKKSIQLRYFLQKYLGFLEPEFYLLPTLVDRGKKAVDAGANTGVFSYRLSSLASEVYAFEPLVNLAERLEEADFPNVRVENAALSDAVGTAVIKIPVMDGVVRHTRASLDGESENVLEQEVMLKPLDAYDLDHVGFLKIDVEGHEYPLLIGAEKTVLANRPNIFIEIERWRLTDEVMAKIFALFPKWDYRGYFYWRGQLLTVDQFDHSLHQAHRENVYKSDDYVNNFIFIPSESSLVLPETINV